MNFTFNLFNSRFFWVLLFLLFLLLINLWIFYCRYLNIGWFLDNLTLCNIVFLAFLLIYNFRPFSLLFWGFNNLCFLLNCSLLIFFRLFLIVNFLFFFDLYLFNYFLCLYSYLNFFFNGWLCFIWFIRVLLWLWFLLLSALFDDWLFNFLCLNYLFGFFCFNIFWFLQFVRTLLFVFLWSLLFF